MTEYGIWCAASGGFVETGIWRLDVAEALLTGLRWAYEAPDAPGEPDDLSVRPICPDHEEEPCDPTCELCDDEYEEVA
ncbi:hypothetical protein [Kribbella sp. NPDC051137]|uniref:hypothetical protein n=1 Tax=Kribbella sp. NPDC051137 TaxID=3155045 RepID=UPI00344161D3